MTGAEGLARSLADASGGHVRAVILYGSRLLKTSPDPHSALDFVVVVGDYRSFYAGLAAAHELHRPVWLMTRLARVLPPNTIAYAPEDGAAGIAKCLVVSSEHFERALGDDPPDHFLLGRLVQRVKTIWEASPEDGEWVADRLSEARRGVLEWLAPYLDPAETVDAAALGRRLLEVCYSGEFRPEAKNRSTRIFEAQEEHFREIFPPVLEHGVQEGILERVHDGAPQAGLDARYRLAGEVPVAQRRRWRRHFRRSKTRATARWLKHMVTFANWLPYIVRKVERHTGRTIHLTRLERALPIIFLWPRAIWVLLTLPPREVKS